MDNKKEVYVKAAIAAAVLLVIWLIMRSRPEQQVLGPAPTLNSFQAPYFTTNPGIPDNPSYVNGGPTFNAAGNTINIQTGDIAGLSRSYMPLFGLVGMTAVQG